MIEQCCICSPDTLIDGILWQLVEPDCPTHGFMNHVVPGRDQHPYELILTAPPMVFGNIFHTQGAA